MKIVQDQVKQQMHEYQQEMDRLTMQREDKLSMELEEYLHKERFK